MKSKLGYLFGIALLVIAAFVAGIAFTVSTSTMEGMQRVAMPGRADITLPAGPSTLYIETRSKVGGQTIDTPGDFNVRCELPGIDLHKPTSRVSYRLAGYNGHNAFDVDVARGATYQLTCESDGGKPFAIAIGAGVGAWIVIGVIAVVPFLGGLALLLVTFIRRRRRVA